MRHKFGLQPADVAMELDGSAMIVRPDSVGTVWDSLTAGSQITDLRDIGGTTPITEITADSVGRVAFQGPDGVTLLYVDFGFGQRFAMSAITIGDELAGKADDVDVVHLSGTETISGNKNLTGTLTWEMPVIEPDSSQISSIKIRNDNDVHSTNSPDLFVIHHKGSDDAHRTFWANEWGGARFDALSQAIIGYADVAVKIFEQDDGNADALQIFITGDGATPSTSSRGGHLTAKKFTSTVGPQVFAGDTTISGKLSGGSDSWQTFSSYVNGYTAYASSTLYTPAGRVAIGGDFVNLRGRVVCDGSATAGETMFTLPTSLRPARQAQIWAVNSAGSVLQLDVNTDGTVVNQRTLSVSWISLDGVGFYKGAN